VHTADSVHPRQPPTNSQDDLAIDQIAQQSVGAAHIVRVTRRDGGGFEAQSGLEHGLGCLAHDLVFRRPAVRQT